jgi:predicted metal-dependent enzyme (double-stranded beta helix superfamily)
VSPQLEKIAFKPINLALGIGAGVLAGLVFKQVWKLAAGDDDAPDAGDEDRGWGEIIAAAALQGAIFAVVKAVVHRSGAVGVRKMTGQWPD